MKCPEGPLACDMFLSLSSTGVGNRNRNRRVAVVVVVASPTPAVHTSFVRPRKPFAVADVTYVRRGCVCVYAWWKGVLSSCPLFCFFFFSLFSDRFFILIKTPALDRVFVCTKKDNYCHYFQSYTYMQTLYRADRFESTTEVIKKKK